MAATTGPPLRTAPASTATAAAAPRRDYRSTLRARNARTACAIGPMQAIAAGSSRHEGLSSPKTTSLTHR
eukprot:5355447-Lingulodinium_polyedra.AAC.1